jgi:hypothetical protein
VPIAADRPYWVEDAEIDVEFHVRHIALPQPGDWRQLCIQVARIHSRPLDRSKPLWEAYVIEGLDNITGLPRGSFALYVKFHHCALDGEAGTEIIKAIHSLSPDPADATAAVARRVRDRNPSALELYSRAVANNLGRLPRLARLATESAGRFAKLGRSALPAASRPGDGRVPPDLKALVRRAPVTRFSGRVSAHRVVESVGLPLQAMRAVRAAVEGATLNDVFLATVGGALNLYLGSKNELPAQSMTAMVPMTLRGANKGEDAGNQIGLVVMQLHTEIADPVARLRAIRAGAGKANGNAARSWWRKPTRRGPRQAGVRRDADVRGDRAHAQPHGSADERRGLERSRTGCPALHGRSTPRQLFADQHRDRRTGTQRYRVQLRRGDVVVHGRLPRDAARSRILRRVSAAEFSGAGRCHATGTATRSSRSSPSAEGHATAPPCACVPEGGCVSSSISDAPWLRRNDRVVSRCRRWQPCDTVTTTGFRLRIARMTAAGHARFVPVPGLRGGGGRSVQ